MKERYRHTQIGWLMLAAMAIVAAVTVYQALHLGPDADPAQLAPWMVVGIILVILSQFATLTVSIDDSAITASFGPGLIRKKVALADIDSCQAVRNHWYNGWGIRIGIGVTLYNVSGLDAVELRLKSGSRIRIGTDEPEALASALKTAISPN